MQNVIVKKFLVHFALMRVKKSSMAYSSQRKCAKMSVACMKVHANSAVDTVSSTLLDCWCWNGFVVTVVWLYITVWHQVLPAFIKKWNVTIFFTFSNT